MQLSGKFPGLTNLRGSAPAGATANCEFYERQ